MSNTVNIVVSSGVVVEVEGLPEDWDITITDLDNNEAATAEAEWLRSEE